jgi:hypothetical protein
MDKHEDLIQRLERLGDAFVAHAVAVTRVIVRASDMRRCATGTIAPISSPGVKCAGQFRWNLVLKDDEETGRRRLARKQSPLVNVGGSRTSTIQSRWFLETFCLTAAYAEEPYFRQSCTAP